jgi:protein-disulfide isomerase
MNDLTRRRLLVLAGALSVAAAARPTGAAEEDPRFAPIVLGDPKAPIEFIEYGSFTCPHCKAFNEDVFAKLKENYIDTGKVRFVFRSVFRNRYDLWATMLVLCDDPKKIEGMIDEVFRSQATWTAGADDAAIAANLKRIGRLAAIPEAKIDGCLNDQDFANALIKRFMADPMQAQVEGTPTFFVNGEKVAGMTYAKWAEFLDAKLPKS